MCVRETVRFDDGTITREYVDHPGAVAVLAMDEQERVLLINQYRQPMRQRDWEIPAGLLDVDGGVAAAGGEARARGGG